MGDNNSNSGPRVLCSGIALPVVSRTDLMIDEWVEFLVGLLREEGCSNSGSD